jgi:hypothetical protein
MDGNVKDAVQKAIEASPDLHAVNIDIKDCRQSYDIEKDVTKVRVELVFEIAKK